MSARYLRQVLRTGAWIALIALTGCSKTVSFQEEVEIAPGKVVVITQERDHEKACEGFKCGWRITEFRIRKSDLVSATWTGTTVPMLLAQREAGDLVLVARDGYCEGPPYQQFALRQGGWVREELDKRFHGRDANLLVAGAIEKSSPRPFTLVDKQKFKERPGIREYHRRILPQAPRNC